MEIQLVQTCMACPEQYDAILGDTLSGTQVGYLRLRHGHFQVRYPDVQGEVIYEADTKGDGLFESEEREFHLGKALEMIRKKLAGT